MAILELYRVSSKGVLCIEARDSILSRLACRFKFSEDYELSAVKKIKLQAELITPQYQILFTDGLRERF